MKVTIVTPTTNGPYLLDTVKSVLAQTHTDIEYIIVTDGVETPLSLPKDDRIKVVNLPFNTGADRWNGHRIYGAFSFLASGDYYCQLDEDDMIDDNHIETLLKTIKNQDFAYSYRKIVSRTGVFICLDSCESLGHHIGCENQHLIGVGSLMLPIELAVQFSPLWYRRARSPGIMEVDRIITKYLLEGYKGKATGEHTMSYRMGNSAISVKPEFFMEGNKKMFKKHNNTFPWHNTKHK